MNASHAGRCARRQPLPLTAARDFTRRFRCSLFKFAYPSRAAGRRQPQGAAARRAPRHAPHRRRGRSCSNGASAPNPTRSTSADRTARIGHRIDSTFVLSGRLSRTMAFAKPRSSRVTRPGGDPPHRPVSRRCMPRSAAAIWSSARWRHFSASASSFQLSSG